MIRCSALRIRIRKYLKIQISDLVKNLEIKFRNSFPNHFVIVKHFFL